MKQNIFLLNLWYKFVNFYSGSIYPKKATRLPGGGIIITKITISKNIGSDCICDLVRKGEINSGWCSIHHTDWA